MVLHVVTRVVCARPAGSTSAQAAERLGFERIHFPDAPGLQGFAAAILDALEGRPASAPAAG